MMFDGNQPVAPSFLSLSRRPSHKSKTPIPAIPMPTSTLAASEFAGMGVKSKSALISIVKLPASVRIAPATSSNWRHTATTGPPPRD